jgi:vomeronasal 2 receptor
MSCFFLSIPVSPGYYQDGDFVIGGLFFRMTDRGDRIEFGLNDTMNMPDDVYL